MTFLSNLLNVGIVFFNSTNITAFFTQLKSVVTKHSKVQILKRLSKCNLFIIKAVLARNCIH